MIKYSKLNLILNKGWNVEYIKILKVSKIVIFSYSKYFLETFKTAGARFQKLKKQMHRETIFVLNF